HHGVEEGKPPEHEAGVEKDDRDPADDRQDVEDQVEKGGNRLPGQEQSQRRAEDRDQVDHGANIGMYAPLSTQSGAPSRERSNAADIVGLVSFRSHLVRLHAAAALAAMHDLPTLISA